MTPCPSDFALDALHLGTAVDADTRRHVETCPRCRERLAARRAIEADFRARLAPRSEPAVLAARRRHRRSMARVGLALAVAGAAAGVLLFVAPRPAAYRGIKGDASMQIVRRRGGAVTAIESGDAVAPGDELRFLPRAATPPFRFVIVASTDGEGRFTPFYPDDEAGESVPLPRAGEALPGGIVIDQARGPERITVLFSDVALRVADAKPMLGQPGDAARPAPDDARVARIEFSLPKRR